MPRVLLFAMPLALVAAWPSHASAAANDQIAWDSKADGSAGVTVKAGEGGFALLTFGRWSAHKTGLPKSQVKRPNHVSRASDMAASFRRAIFLPIVETAERQYALPRGLLDALIWTESRYDPLALSKAGAVGLGQLMPRTAQSVKVRNRYDPTTNVGGAALYLRQLLDQLGMVHLAVAAYNAGPKAVLRAGGIPRNGETPEYVRQVLRYWRL